jgi:serine/threonine protein phosphatase 1
MRDTMYIRESPGVTPPGSGAGGRLVYAIGDVHGRYDLLKALLAQIVGDCRVRAAEQRPMLVFCGDYIDRGSQSAEVVEALLWLRGRPEFETRLLKGNHEQGMLQFLATPEAGRGWLRFGGDATLASYGVRPPRQDDDDAALVQARDALEIRLPPEHRALMEGLELMVVVGGYAFVHAGVRPGVPLAEQAEGDLLWIRDEFLNASGPFEKVIVHGHSWSGASPQMRGHRIGIDTGAYETGVLTAVRLEGDGVRIFDTSDEPAAVAV